jgi:hypothetical protein
MSRRSKRFRVTIAAMMAVVAVFSVAVLFTVPLYRVGRPPCLKIMPTARWLVNRPGAASCTDCHANPRREVAVRIDRSGGLP